MIVSFVHSLSIELNFTIAITSIRIFHEIIDQEFAADKLILQKNVHKRNYAYEMYMLIPTTTHLNENYSV